MRKKILFICKTESIHSARWIRQLDRNLFDVYIFPEQSSLRVHGDLSGHTICIPFYGAVKFLKKIGIGKYLEVAHFFFSKIRSRFNKDYHLQRLSSTIRRIKPHLIHSLETQGAGYLVSLLKQQYFVSRPFPVWWHTNWGSDIYLFGRLQKHKPLIRKVLEDCDYYSCECERDVLLARKFGFKGIALPVYPNTGGFHIDDIALLRKNAEPTSKRKTIMLKGYQGWAGRALVGIRALEKCVDILEGYTVIIYSNPYGEDVSIAAQLLTDTTGIPVKILPAEVPHIEILKYHLCARISIGLSIGDAISTSLLEAMVMGSFPIQSCTSCATEWIKDGIGGMVVLPEDSDNIEIAIRKALKDDVLVDTAAEINYHTIKEKASFTKLQEMTIQSYNMILSNANIVQQKESR